MSAARIERVRAALRAAEIDAIMLGPSADFRYLAGYETMPMERLTMLVLPAEGEARIVTPAFEAPLAPAGIADLGIAIDPWGETEDPIARAIDAVPRGARRVAAGDQLAAMFLVPLQQRLQADWVLGSAVMRPLRMVKDADEVAALAEAGAAVDRAVSRAAGAGTSWGHGARDRGRPRPCDPRRGARADRLHRHRLGTQRRLAAPRVRRPRDRAR